MAWYTSIRLTGTTLPAGTVTCWPLPATVALTVAVAPFAVSVTVHAEPAGMPSKLCDTLPSPPLRRGSRSPATGGAVAGHVDRDRSLVAGERAGDGLGDEQRAGAAGLDRRR